MSLFRNGVTAIATATIILGLGYLVQNDGIADTRSVRKASQPAANTVNSVMMSKNSAGVAVFGMPSTVNAPQPQVENILAVAAIDAQFAEVNTPPVSFMLGSPLDGCDTGLTAEPQLAAMVALTITSPCHADADVVVRHERMSFSVRTDAQGNATVMTPALQTRATFIVTFDNIEEARATVEVTDVNQYDRAVLLWRGNRNIQLHALEFGATIGDPGHIWSASTNSPTLAHQGQRGFMMRLGSSNATIPYWAEVYTFPSGSVSRDGQIKLQVGAAVTEENCGRELDVMGIQTNAGRLLISKDFDIQMPDCALIGQSVMRADLFEELTLAAR